MSRSSTSPWRSPSTCRRSIPTRSTSSCVPSVPKTRPTSWSASGWRRHVARAGESSTPPAGGDVFHGSGPGVSAAGRDAEPRDEVRPTDRVLCGLGRDEPGVFQLDAGDGAARLEGHAQAGCARRHRGVSGFAPGDLDEMWSIDADEMPAYQHAVDVNREDSPVDRFEACDVAHPANEELRAHEVIEDPLRRGLDVDGRSKGVAHPFFSSSCLSAASFCTQKASTKATTGAKPSGLIE